MDQYYEQKYLKYKFKYLQLKNQLGSAKNGVDDWEKKMDTFLASKSGSSKSGSKSKKSSPVLAAAPAAAAPAAAVVAPVLPVVSLSGKVLLGDFTDEYLKNTSNNELEFVIGKDNMIRIIERIHEQDCVYVADINQVKTLAKADPRVNEMFKKVKKIKMINPDKDRFKLKESSDGMTMFIKKTILASL
jgi:hypothetical protein